tara:strand:- start:1965 stop:2390 length:426 start_codon:yes stop_codon:yes gene_type:complete
MNGNTYGKLLLSGVSFTSISGMTYLIYEDTKRQNNNDIIQNENTNKIILPTPIEGSTYVSPYLRSYGSTYVKPIPLNENTIPAVNGYYDNNRQVNNCIILTNLEDNVYRDNKCNLVSFNKIIKNKNFICEDRYDKFLNYFE